MTRHTLEPIYDTNSRILILGSFPSVKSRETNFYYGHPQNRFWKVLSSILECPLPMTKQEKKKMLLERKIALWDVIESCDILGSSDSSIKNVTSNNLSRILENSEVRKIYVNGNKAYQLYMRYIYPINGIEPIRLPSTSPANAAYSLESLIECWKLIISDL